MSWLTAIWQGLCSIASAFGEYIKQKPYLDNRSDTLELERLRNDLRAAQNVRDSFLPGCNYYNAADVTCKRLCAEIKAVSERIRTNTGK